MNFLLGKMSFLSASILLQKELYALFPHPKCTKSSFETPIV
jgi:hypothetical protein